jgi:hypothetical protein
VKDLAAYKTKALEFILRKQGPVLVGEVCLFLGPFCSLRDAEEILSELATEKLIRRLSPDELDRIDLVIAYVAV